MFNNSALPIGPKPAFKSEQLLYIFLKILFIFFLERGEGREEDRERNINVWVPLTQPSLGTWPATQACALTGNQTSNPLVHRPELNPLSHTSQGPFVILLKGEI